VFVLFGAGNNGKTTLLVVFRTLIREHAVLLQVDTLMVRQESNNTQADLADLRGARFVQTSETEEGQRLAQGKLKRITQGMGMIKACRKYENPIEFPETHKLWIDTNRKPLIRDADDHATFNRLQPIPFTYCVPKHQIDRALVPKLLAEAEGILAWAVAGAKLWFESGLNKPDEVAAACNEWRSEVDQLGQFIDECCIVGEGFTVLAGTLFAQYKRWIDENGESHTMTSTAFGRKLTERNFEKRHTKPGWRYQGIGLRATAEDAEDV
jgi:putative DNA primase/helicase